MGSLEWALLVVLSVLWGASFFFVGVAVRALPPLTIVALRVAVAAMVLHLTARVLGLRLPRDRGTWSAFAWMGALNNLVPFSLIVWGQTHIASGLASILNATTPLFAVVVAHLWTHDEKATAGRVAGLLLGIAGVVVMMGPEALGGLGTDVLAQIAVLVASLSYAVASVYGRRFGRLGVHPVATAAGQVTASTAMLIPLAVLVDRPWTLPMPGAGAWGAVLGLATLSTAFAYIIYFRVLATAGATNILLVTFLVPVSALLLGTTLLAEPLLATHLAGMGLIGLGLAAIDGRPLATLGSRVARR